METKYTVIFLVVCLLCSGLALAEKGGNSDDNSVGSSDDAGPDDKGGDVNGGGHGSDDVGPDDKGTDILDDKGLGDVNRTQSKDQDRNKSQTQDQDRNQTQDKVKTQSKVHDPAQVLDQVRNRTAEHRALLDAKLANVSNRDKLKIFQNENAVREAVMALLALREAGNFSGGIGQNISAIAREFDNSINKTTAAEEAMVDRDGLTRLLFGGDENAAKTLQAELNQNRVRIQQLERLRTQLDDPEYQAFIDQQLRVLTEQQDILEQRAGKELGDKGLLGWLFK